MRLTAPHPPRSKRARAAKRRRLAALAGLALLAFLVGIVLGAVHKSSAQRAAERYVRAWERDDYATMYRQLTPGSKLRLSPAEFRSAYRKASDTATTVRLGAGKPHDEGGGWVRVPMTVTTRVFGSLRADLRLRTKGGKVSWSPALVFPGIPRAAELRRSTIVPQRAPILARNGRRIVEGSASGRTSPFGAVGESIAGSVGEAATPQDRERLFARGFPADTPVGLSGLERIFEEQVAGQPGGTLSAGNRTLASAPARPSGPVRTTVDMEVQAAAVQALAGRFGGIAALDARTGEVRALAGVAFSAPQPPGSTFKVITATAALQAHLVNPATQFPVETKAVIDGVDLENANGESCGGTFAASFANSCNSVFAPLGVKVGAKRLVDAAERYGFNQQPPIPGALPSTIPAAAEIGTPLAVGSTAIGQGRVLATPLELASVAQTVASGGLRRTPTLVPGRRSAAPKRVASRRTAATLERLMIGVVQYGTGVRAAIPGVTVAGKTGTAELETTVKKDEEREQPPPSEQNEPPGSKTDAWFTGYAPARHSRIAVCVLLVRQGAGGDTAAPAARTVLQAGLH